MTKIDLGIDVTLWYEYGLGEHCPTPSEGWEGGEWTLEELGWLESAIGDMVDAFARNGGDGLAKFHMAMGYPRIRQAEIMDPIRSNYSMFTDTVVLEDSTAFSDDEDRARYVIIHEFGHAWNWKSRHLLAMYMRDEVGYGMGVRCSELGCYIEAASDPPGYKSNQDYLHQINEDWANSFTAFVDPDLPNFVPPNGVKLNRVRRKFIEEEMCRLR